MEPTVRTEESCRFRPPLTGRQVTWEVTRFCDLTCDHCCSHSGPDVDRRRESSVDVLIAAATQLPDLGVTKVYFSGGEPLLKKGFLDLVEVIDTSAIQVNVATNGYHLSDPVVARLRRAGITKLSVSVDGGDAAHHDGLRRRAGAFARTLGGIERAVAAGLRVGVSVTVTPTNIGTLDTLVASLIRVGASAVSFHSVLPLGRAAGHPELLLDVEGARMLDRTMRDLEARQDLPITIDHGFGPGGSRAERGCPAQTRLIHIDSSGNVSVCSWLCKAQPDAFTLGNIKETPLREIVGVQCRALEALLQETDSCPLPMLTARGTPS
ncbi:MAG: radical SAM protein [Kineosporiaceae bacterium]